MTTNEDSLPSLYGLHASYTRISCMYTYACNNVGIAVVKKTNKIISMFLLLVQSYLYMSVHFLEMFLLHNCLLYFFKS